jgi:hypothetical protein
MIAVPLCARSAAAIIGGILVLVAWTNVIGTLIVPRPIGSGLGRYGRVRAGSPTRRSRRTGRRPASAEGT